MAEETMNQKVIELHHGEKIIAVVPESCRGPGWSNPVVWVHIVTVDGRHLAVCIQPIERTPAMHVLFASGESMCQSLLDAVPVKKCKTEESK
jgi:hypothetical protein